MGSLGVRKMHSLIRIGHLFRITTYLTDSRPTANLCRKNAY